MEFVCTVVSKIILHAMYRRNRPYGSIGGNYNFSWYAKLTYHGEWISWRSLFTNCSERKRLANALWVLVTSPEVETCYCLCCYWRWCRRRDSTTQWNTIIGTKRRPTTSLWGRGSQIWLKRQHFFHFWQWGWSQRILRWMFCSRERVGSWWGRRWATE